MNTYLTSTLHILNMLVNSLYGGWSSTLTTLLLIMTIDFTVKFMLITIYKTEQCNTLCGFQYLAKKFIVLFFIIIGQRLDITLDVNYIKDTICIGFIVNEILSVIKNATFVGFPVPKTILTALDVLQNKKSVN